MTFDPTQNRVQTCLLTADEHRNLNAAIKLNGGEYYHNGQWVAKHDDYLWSGSIYRAKPAPAPTLSITVNGVTNVVAAGVTEALAQHQVYWVPCPSSARKVDFWHWTNTDDCQRRLREGLIHTSEAAARAHAMAIVGLKAEGV